MKQQLIKALGVAALSTVTMGLFITHAAADPVPVTGGCYGGGPMSYNVVPGTGSGGHNVVQSGLLSGCGSPLLPSGIAGGTLTVSYPASFLQSSPASGNIAWSNGQSSAISGSWLQGANTMFAITGGLGAGNHLMLNHYVDRHGTEHVTSALLAP